jgi:hypothetical protein
MDQRRLNTTLESFCMVEIRIRKPLGLATTARQFTNGLQSTKNRFDADFRSLVNDWG